MRDKTEDCLLEEGIWSKVGSFHSIAWLISDAPTVTRDTKEQTFLVTSQIRLLSKEKRNHGNSARLTREQWRGPRGFENSRHGTMKPVLSARWAACLPPSLPILCYTFQSVINTPCKRLGDTRLRSLRRASALKR